MTHPAPFGTAQPRFCTEHSLAAGEPLAGWGAHPARNILIRWPKGKWRHSLRIAADMGDAVEVAIARAVDAGWRINLIDRKGEPDERLRVFVFPDGLAFDLDPASLPAFLDAVPLGQDALQPFAPVPVRSALILCCTHGQHDACCAKWGFATYKALAAAAAGRDDFDIWEATHLGGCRFAGGVLVLPALRKYGRVRAEHGAALLDAEAQGRAYLPCYRGASDLHPAAQAAEVAGLQHLAALGHYGVPKVRQIAEHAYDVTLPGGAACVHVTPDEVRSYGACADLKAAAPLTPKTVWRGDVHSAATKVS
ncbi:sucrase ferredoxin [Yoonia sp.]|uniref:sucrase ferredoxin n=1 Tax=Yoonia sp. TaxID=2212373 RepID=UPI00391A2F1A